MSRLRIEWLGLNVSGEDEVVIESDVGEEGGDAKLLVVGVYRTQVLLRDQSREEVVHVGL